LELEEELKVVGNAMHSLQIFEQEVICYRLISHLLVNLYNLLTTASVAAATTATSHEYTNNLLKVVTQQRYEPEVKVSTWISPVGQPSVANYFAVTI